jgi:hypothetical protein
MSPKIVPIRPSAADGVLDEAAKIEKINRYGELDRLLSLSKPYKDEAEVLKDEIESWHENDPADKGAISTGTLYRIHLTAKRNARALIDKKKAFHLLRKKLGFDGLMAILDIPLGAIDKAIPKSEQSFIHEERSGYRSLTVVALQPIQDLKAA